MHRNGIANALTIFGVVEMVAGVIIGFVLGDEFGATLGFSVFITSVVNGFLFLGFAEVIKLLEWSNENNYNNNKDIAKKLDKLIELQEQNIIQENEENLNKSKYNKKDTIEKTTEIKEEPDEYFNAPSQVALTIKSNYPKQWDGMKAVKATPFKSYYVTVFSTYIEIVKLDEHTPKIIDQNTDSNYEEIYRWIEQNKSKF